MGEKGARPAPPDTSGNDRVIDVLLAVAVLAVSVPATVTGHSLSPLSAPVWVQILSGPVAAAGVLVRRRPVWRMVAAAAACTLLSGQLPPLTLAAFAMTAAGALRRWQWVAAALALVYLVADQAGSYAGGALPP